MGQKVSLRFVSDGNAKPFDIGFIPDEIHAFRDLDGGTNELEYWFFRVLADAEDDGQYGIAITQAGDIAACADANNGFIEYEEGEDLGVLIEHPGSGKKVYASVNDWTSAISTAATARSATAVGTVVRPTTHNGCVYECTTAGTSSGTEPSTWTTTPGETVTDSTTVFTCRQEEVVKGGGQGFQIGATIMTDGEEWLVTAEKHDKYEDLGDIDGKDVVRWSSQP